MNTPTVLAPTFDKIPPEMQAEPRWLMWRLLKRDGRMTKVPYQIDGRAATSTDPATWTTFSIAREAYAAGGFDGVGFALGDGWSALDLDKVIADGAVDDDAEALVKETGSYAEISPSGTGVRVIMRGTKPDGAPSKVGPPQWAYVLEVYDRGRFVTITGMAVFGQTTIEDGTETLATLAARMAEAKGARRMPEENGGVTRATSPPMSDEDVIELAEDATNAGKFKRLMDGDAGEYGGDASRADAGLVSMLAFYTQDREQILRIVRGSALWDEKWKREDYQKRTLDLALNGRREVYTSPAQARARLDQLEAMWATKPVSDGAMEMVIYDDVTDPGGERYTDAENARRLADEAAGRIVHADEMKEKWFVWDGSRFVLSDKAAVVPLVLQVAKRIYAEVAKLGAEDAKRFAKIIKARLDGAKYLEDRSGCYAAIELAKAEPRLRADIKVFDTHPLWLNTPSGTLDLETGETWAPRFEDRLTKISGAAYDPAATCPRWDAFLVDVLPNEDVRAFMQRSVGLTLTDITVEQCLWFLYGLGRNGKTTFLNAVRAVLGDYASSVPASTLMVKAHGDDKRNDVARLRGARFVAANEAEEGQQMAEALIKQLTGDDPITCRFLYTEYFEFQATFKIMLAANHKPAIRGQDLAMWRRIHLVPFTETIPLDKVDILLPAALAAEASGILNWAVAGFRSWQEGGLRPPEAVLAATAEYRAESDPLGDFFETCTVRDAGARVVASALYDSYRIWAARAGVRLPLTKKALGQKLEERGYTADRSADAARTRGWRGLLLRPTAIEVR